METRNYTEEMKVVRELRHLFKKAYLEPSKEYATMVRNSHDITGGFKLTRNKDYMENPIRIDINEGSIFNKIDKEYYKRKIIKILEENNFKYKDRGYYLEVLK